jgi:Protein of unknown function (DUF998)
VLTVRIVRNVPWWGLVSSAAAPVLLVGGWTAAARLQPRPVDPVADTVSVLAAVGAADRWVMTLTLALVGLCYIVTGIALRPAGPAGRLILAVGAAAGMLVTVNPQPAEGGSVSHAVWAAAGFVALAVWPAGAWRRGSLVPWGLRPAVCLGAVAVLVVLQAWFCAEVVAGAGHAGLAELVLGLAQAVWPLTVVLSCRHPATAPVGHAPSAA